MRIFISFLKVFFISQFLVGILMGACFGAPLDLGDAPENFKPILKQFLQQAKATCASIDNGKISINLDEIQYAVDFNEDGINDPIMDDHMFTCSSGAEAFAGGSGGHVYTIFVSNEKGSYTGFEFLARAAYVFRHDTPYMFIVSVHGGACDLAGAAPCFEAYVWGDGNFVAPNATVKPMDLSRRASPE